jgi:sortase A
MVRSEGELVDTLNIMDKVLTVLGRTFIGAGVIVFLFVGYQLWGTNFAEARAQDRLQAEAEQAFAEVSTDSGGDEAEEPPADDDNADEAAPEPTDAPAPAAPPTPEGEAVAIIEIPKIGLKKAVVSGTSVDDLKKGPGHYRSTPLPGQPGNAAIAGHRTTYGAPFGDLGALSPGDAINVTTRQGSFRYLVSSQRIVAPTEVSVLNPTDDNRLTLTTCHPKYSAAQRMIITATLDETPAPATPVGEDNTNEGGSGGSDENPATEEEPIPGAEEASGSTPESEVASAQEIGLSGEEVSKTPAILWGVGAALVALLVWAAGFMWRRLPAYLVGTPIFLVVLFIFFENFSRLLPANA